MQILRATTGETNNLGTIISGMRRKIHDETAGLALSLSLIYADALGFLLRYVRHARSFSRNSTEQIEATAEYPETSMRSHRATGTTISFTFDFTTGTAHVHTYRSRHGVGRRNAAARCGQIRE